MSLTKIVTFMSKNNCSTGNYYQCSLKNIVNLWAHFYRGCLVTLRHDDPIETCNTAARVGETDDTETSNFF